MANRQTTFLLKRSNVPGKIPPSSGLTSGELALNTADAILYTSGSTANQILPIGWDRISRTGDTVTGDFNIFGDVAISGSSLPNGYALTVTGDTDILGDLYVEGDIDYDGNLTVSGTTYLQGLSATTISATTIGTSGDCVDDIYVSNIHSCSPLNINPLDEGNVYFGSTSGVTFDLLNNKVGIGTSTPSTIFQVVGNYTGGTDALIPQMLFQNSNTIPNTNKTAIIRTTVGTGYVAGGYPEIWLESQETSTGVGLTKLRTVSNHPLLFYTNDLERVRLTETGNFGINTPSPSGKLHVRTGVNKNIIFTSGSTGNQIRSLVDGNASYTGLDLDTLDLNIKTNGVDRMIINSSGDTGIGITSPAAKLHINNTTSGNTFLAEDDTNPDSSPFVIDASGNTGIGTLTPTAKLQVKVNDFDPVNYGFAVSDSGNTSTYFAVNNVGQVAIRTPYTGSNNQFLIKNTNFGAAEVRFNVSGDYAFSMLDNQGYGFTSNPNSININTRSTNGLINIWTQAANTTILALGGQDINPTVARTRTIIRPVQSNAFAFIPTGGTAIEYSFESQANSTFQPTGGTATYTQIQLRPTYNTTGSYSGTVRGLYYNPILTSLSGTTHRAIETTTGDVIFGSTSGNVGIGTTTPTAKLHINNTTSGNTFLVEDDTNPDSSPFVIDASGNTGIGIIPQSPFKLDVNGDVRIYSGITSWAGTQFTNGGIRVTTSSGIAGGISFDATTPQANRINYNTNFTIGSTSSTSTGNNLTINGGAILPTTGTTSLIGITANVASTSGGTNQINGLLLNPNITLVSGNVSTLFRGIYYNPTLTSIIGLTTHRAIETVVGDVLFGTTSGNVGIGLTGTTAKLHINNTTSGNTFLAEDDTNPDSTPFVIDASGNTGIGTLTPSAKLDIFASSALTNTLRIRDTGNTFNNLTINSQGLTELRTNGGGLATQFSVVHNGGTENFRVRENGNISFRTANAFDNSSQMSINVGRDLTNGLNIGPLNTYDTSNTNRNLVGFIPSFSWAGGNNTGSTLNIAPTYNIIGGSTTALVRGIYYNPSLQSLSGTTHRAIETTTGDVIFGSTSGNVGIGTTTPLAKLDVVGGDVALNGNRLFLGSYLGNQVLRNVETTNLQLFNSVGVLYLNAGDRVIFGSNNSTSGRWATFFNTGNLLIQSGGTHTDVGFKLDVIGNTRISGDTIISSGLSASTVTITTQPTSGYTSTEILMRNSTTGQVEITDSTSPSIYNYGMSYAMTTFNYLT